MNTKIAFIADLHVGEPRKFATPSHGRAAPINSRAAQVVDVVAAARRLAEQEGCSHLFVLGDVFDTSRPSPQLIAETQLALASLKGIEVHIIIGNHDQQSPAKGDHACVSMEGIRNLTVHEKPTEVYIDDETTVLLHPYHPGRADEYLVEEVRDRAAQARARHPKGVVVLGLHLGIRDDATPTWLQNAHDSFPVNRIPELGEIDYVLAGNWHERKQFSPGVWQVGAVCPTGFDNPGLTGYGTVLVLDPTGNKARARAIEIDGPRFVRATGLAGARQTMEAVEARPTGWPVYTSVRCRLEERAEVQELFELYDYTAYEILTDKAAAEDAARSAASAAAYASTDSIQAAVSAYVDKMALPDDIVRDDVRARAIDYVAGAAQ